MQRIELLYSAQHCNKTPVDTEGKKQPELIYPAETTARSRENSPPDVSVYQTAQITSNPRNDTKTNATPGKYYPSMPRKRNPT